MKNFKSYINKEVYDVLSDNGNHTTKAKCRETEIVIPTLLSIGGDRMSQGGYVIEDYQGQSYVVGDENKTINTNIQLSKIDLTHKLSCYVAIHQLVPNNAEVNLYVGLPLQTFYNVDYREKYTDFFHDDIVTLKVNGVEKTFTINKVIALPEGVGYVFTHNIYGLTGVVDIGHLTIDCAVYQDCTPILSTVFTTLDGASSLKTLVRDELNSKLLLNIQDYQINEIMTQGLYGAKRTQANEIIHECKINYLRNIANEMIKHGWELETMPIVFTGGGSLLLHDVINMFETFSLSDEPLFDNIKGFVELGELTND